LEKDAPEYADHGSSIGHGIHAGIHWRSDTDVSMLLARRRRSMRSSPFTSQSLAERRLPSPTNTADRPVPPFHRGKAQKNAVYEILYRNQQLAEQLEEYDPKYRRPKAARTPHNKPPDG
jgi:hypothetical protein